MNKIDKEFEDSFNQVVNDLIEDNKDNVDEDNLYLSIINNYRAD